MELNETISVLNVMTEDKAKNYCENKKHDPPQSGPNLIDGYTGTPTPENLLKNMAKHKRNKTDGPPEIPIMPKKKAGSKLWDIEQCSKSRYPFQTHHIIPKKFLPTQEVCLWLTKKYTKHKQYQLAKDTRYSTDHSNNGYCLPFVSTTYQWKNAKNDADKDEAAALMMRKTGKQLHQGNHNTVNFQEQDDIELEEYLNSIKALLKRINESAFDHVDCCNFCKQDGKKKIQPLHKIVDQVDVVSLITKLRIDANQIFVSQRAYDYYKSQKKK